MSQFYESGPRVPFPILMDPDSIAHDAYGAELAPACVSFEMLKAMCGKGMTCSMVKGAIERGEAVPCRTPNATITHAQHLIECDTSTLRTCRLNSSLNPT
jgi:hypothetical protein